MGVTAGDVVTELAQVQATTMRPCPRGLKVVLWSSWRAGPSTLVAEIGSGPDGNSLTADSQRSLGSGAEEVSGSPVWARPATSVA